MLAQAIRFVRLAYVLIGIYAISRFILGLVGVPYAPRGNAMFSVVGATVISSFYFGALSQRAGFNWLGTALTGASIGVYAQLWIFVLTLVSFVGNFETSYFRHWDALNVTEGTVVPMAQALGARAVGLIVNTIIAMVVAMVGRVFGGRLAPKAS